MLPHPFFPVSLLVDYISKMTSAGTTGFVGGAGLTSAGYLQHGQFYQTRCNSSQSRQYCNVGLGSARSC